MFTRIVAALFVAMWSFGFISPAEAAVREVFAADSFLLSNGQHIVVDAWELEVHVRGADIDVARLTTDLRISGLGAAKADAWITARTPVVQPTENGLTLHTSQGDEGFLGIGSFTRRRRLGIVAPLTSVPDISTSSGSINIEGDFAVADPLRLRTASGDLSLTGAASSLEVRTTSGNADIDVVRPLGRFWIRTSSGAVTLHGGARSVEIETASGSIDLSGLSGSASVETVSGNIVVSWDRVPDDATIKLRSIKGSITVILPAETLPRGMLSTTSGHISSEFPGQIAEDDASVSLTGSGPTLEIETGSGPIVLMIDPGWFAPKE